MKITAKALRALGRYWQDHDIHPHPLDKEDFARVLDLMVAYLITKKVKNMIPVFCEGYSLLHQSIESHSFQCLGNCEEASLYSVSSDSSLEWLNKGLETAFTKEAFIVSFFDALADLVMEHAELITNPFGTVSIPTDTSITAALVDLPPGFREILLKLQFEIAKKTAPSLFLAVYDSEVGFGGPGTTLRLIIDMVESQLFNKKAIESRLVFQPLEKHPDTTYAEALFDSIMDVIGPFPCNMAYGPILMHLFYLEAAEKRYDLLNQFIEHCRSSEYGLGVHSVHDMGLLSVISSFIFGSAPPVLASRSDDLFCRSQIDHEVVCELLPFEMMKSVLDCVWDLKNYDDFAILSISAALPFIDRFRLELVSETHLSKVYDLLLGDRESYIELLDEEDYEKLVEVCCQILGPRELNVEPSTSKQKKQKKKVTKRKKSSC